MLLLLLLLFSRRYTLASETKAINGKEKKEKGDRRIDDIWILSSSAIQDHRRGLTSRKKPFVTVKQMRRRYSAHLWAWTSLLLPSLPPPPILSFLPPISLPPPLISSPSLFFHVSLLPSSLPYPYFPPTSLIPSTPPHPLPFPSNYPMLLLSFILDFPPLSPPPTYFPPPSLVLTYFSPLSLPPPLLSPPPSFSALPFSPPPFRAFPPTPFLALLPCSGNAEGVKC